MCGGEMMYWVVASLLLLLLAFVCYRWGYQPFQVFKKMGIPGPPPLPFLGNIITLIIRKEGLDMIAEWNKQYGSICGYFCGTWPGMSTTDPDFIQQVFITNFAQFPDRGVMSISNTQATGLPPGLFEYTNIEKWRKIRHITLQAFSKSKLNKMSHYLERSCGVMVDRMLDESSLHHNIDLMRIYRDCVLESSILVVLGQEVCLQRGEAQEFKSWMELGTKISHGKHPLCQIYMYMPIDIFIGYQFPWLIKFYYWLGLGGYLPSLRRLKATITNCIAERRDKAKRQQLQENSVLDLLVAASEGSDNDGETLSDEDIISNCLIFLFAAYDTTSLTLTCVSHLLATNPLVQDKLCTLLDDYWAQHQDASVSTVAQDVSYLDMVLDETLRLYPPGPRLTRVCREETEICGVTIPKHMNVLVPVHYLHRMESIWGDPENFRPERFEREESEGRHMCAFMPMGLGPRNCIGLKLAKLLMKMVLVSVLRKYRFVRTAETPHQLKTQCYCVNLNLINDCVLVDLQQR